MILQLFNLMGWQMPAAFGYTSTRMLLSAMTALIFVFFLGPKCIKKLYEMKTGQSIRVEDCPLLAELHKKKKETPTMGGILILAGMLLSLFLFMDLKSGYTLVLFVTTVSLGLIGGYDDFLKLKYRNSKGLPAKVKFGLQLLVSSLIALYLLCPAVTEAVQIGSWFVAPVAKFGAETLSTQAYMGFNYIPFLRDPVLILQGGFLLFSFFSILFVITGSSNAVNLTDGLDGLASGCLILVASVFALVAFLSNNMEMARLLNLLYIENSGEIAIYLSAMIGALIGFLWYNGHPAQIFMGDTGSLALGGVIAVAAILLRREFLLSLVGGVFVAEALSVILQVGSYKLRNRRRIFLCAPLHHHFEYRGLPETKVVLRFWIVGLLLAMIGLISLKLQ